MRPIKFRAWDTKNKCMESPASWLLLTQTGTVLFSGPMSPVRQAADGQYLVEFFTGHTDKNGEEIFEGDIVRLRCSGVGGACDRAGVMAVIEWLEERACFWPRILDKMVHVDFGSQAGKKVHMGEIHGWAGMHHCWSRGWGYIEVVGNIHENPELL